MEPRVITDAAGRRLTLRKVGVLEMLRLYKAMGAELALNQPYMGVVAAAAAVAMLDEVPLPFPATEAAVAAAIERIGDAGIALAAAAIRPAGLPEVVAEAGN